MSKRSFIYSPARAAQIRDFQGMRFGNITPTDIDAVIDFGGKAYVFIETKVRGTPLPLGQRLLLERLCDDLNSEHVEALVLIAEHSTPAANNILVATAKVCEYRNAERQWKPCHDGTYNVMSAIQVFLKRRGLDKIYQVAREDVSA